MISSAVSALFDVRGPLGFDLFKRPLAFVHLYGLLRGGHIRQVRKASGCLETLERGGVRLVESLAFGTTIHLSFSLFAVSMLGRWSANSGIQGN